MLLSATSFQRSAIVESILSRISEVRIYNTFNHTQFSGVDTGSRWDAAGTQINTNLGFYTGAGLGRRMQFGLKLFF